MYKDHTDFVKVRNECGRLCCTQGWFIDKISVLYYCTNADQQQSNLSPAQKKVGVIMSKKEKIRFCKSSE